MTMPSERTRALLWAYELLVELRSADNLTEPQKQQVRTVLRHYPTPLEITNQARLDVARNGGDPQALVFDEPPPVGGAP